MPWRIIARSNQLGIRRLFVTDDAVGRTVATFDAPPNRGLDPRDKANAELMVRAVNAHQELLDAAKLGRAYMRMQARSEAGRDPSQMLQSELAQVEAAIANAEGA